MGCKINDHPTDKDAYLVELHEDGFTWATVSVPKSVKLQMIENAALWLMGGWIVYNFEKAPREWWESLKVTEEDLNERWKLLAMAKRQKLLNN